METKTEFPIKDAFYRLNSDNKVELHIPGKEDYKNLPEEIKKDIRSGFLWGRQRGAWVSRSKGGAVPWSMKKYGIPYKGAEDIKGFEESQEQKTDRLEAKADRFRGYAGNAKNRAQALQSEFNRLRKDWAWLTQPNVNTSGGRAFTNSRNRVLDRYDRGMHELKRAHEMEEYAARLETGASQTELKDIGYLRNRVKENEKLVKKFPGFERYYNAKTEEGNLTDEALMYLDGQMNMLRLAFDKLVYFQHHLGLLEKELEGKGKLFDYASAKKTIKKDFKAFLKEHYGIKLENMSIAFESKRGVFYYYRTEQPLPPVFHSGYAADNAAQMDAKAIYALMEKIKAAGGTAKE